jgi:hypothetical protein
MKHVTDVIRSKRPDPASTKIPPMNIPTALFMLFLNHPILEDGDS